MGLEVATITSFYLYLVPQLKPGTGDETVALLRVILYNMNKTAFGGDVPTLSDWERPPAGSFHARTLLLACLCVLLLCGVYILTIKFLAGGYALARRGKFLDRLVHKVLFLMYQILWFGLVGTATAALILV